jgi:hypothetical protein
MDWSQPKNRKLVQTAMTTWAAKQLPTRLDVVQTSKELRFRKSDI